MHPFIGFDRSRGFLDKEYPHCHTRVDNLNLRIDERPDSHAKLVGIVEQFSVQLFGANRILMGIITPVVIAFAIGAGEHSNALHH